MIYLITALDAEARPLIDHYRLKRVYDLPYTVYRGESLLLLVTQPGRGNAMMAVSALLGYALPSQNDILINVGVCAAPQEYPLGEALIIHQIFDQTRRYYPDILYPHGVRESSLICVDAPQSAPSEHPVDMESAGVFAAASRFFPLHRVAFLKIVSDHFEPERVSKEGVIEAVKHHVETLVTVINGLRSVAAKAPLFTPHEREEIERLKRFFTKSQGDALEDALAYFRLKSPDLELNLDVSSLPESKRERSQLHERLIAALTA